MKYRVKYGVDLWLLAAWFYGNPALFDIIYYANEDSIGIDPENISPGMELEIPDLERSSYKIILPAAGEAS